MIEGNRKNLHMIVEMESLFQVKIELITDHGMRVTETPSDVAGYRTVETKKEPKQFEEVNQESVPLDSTQHIVDVPKHEQYQNDHV